MGVGRLAEGAECDRSRAREAADCPENHVCRRVAGRGMGRSGVGGVGPR